MDYVQELEQIRLRNNGFLRPQDVVEFARDPNTALHSHFTWDDSEAADKYRLAQARVVIRIAVVVNSDNSENVRAYVSLSDERYEGVGYRAIVEVLDDEILKEKLLQTAMKEMDSFRRKYNRLRDIASVAPVLDAIENVMPEQASRVVNG